MNKVISILKVVVLPIVILIIFLVSIPLFQSCKTAMFMKEPQQIEGESYACYMARWARWAAAKGQYQPNADKYEDLCIKTKMYEYAKEKGNRWEKDDEQDTYDKID